MSAVPAVGVCLSLAAGSLTELQQRLAAVNAARANRTPEARAAGRQSGLPSTSPGSAARGRATRVDLIEIRLDALRDRPAESLSTAELADLCARAAVPLIVTCRPRWEGGGYGAESNADVGASSSEVERIQLLRRALDAGAAYIDVELEAASAAELVGEVGDRVVLSWHAAAPINLADVAGRAELESRIKACLELRPAVVKLVAPARSPADAIPLLDALRELVAAGQHATAFCMDEEGRASRLLALAQGGCWIYARESDALAPAASSAPTATGQWSLDDLAALRTHRWSSASALYGVLGDPVEHSLSPLIFNAAFADQELDAAYLPMGGADLPAVLRLAEHVGIRGLSVTMPHKQAVLRSCAEVSGTARRIGAVNTLVVGESGWRGHNTDGTGVVGALMPHLQLRDARATVLGAGGAARGAVVALAEAGARVRVLNRTLERARELADLAAEVASAVIAVAPVTPGSADVDSKIAGQRGRASFGALDDFPNEGCDVLVDATSVGMKDAADTAIPTAWLNGDEVVLDMVYRPLETALLRGAAERGCVTVPGLEMFLLQAAEQYRLWFDREPPMEPMRSAALAALAVGVCGVQGS